MTFLDMQKDPDRYSFASEDTVDVRYVYIEILQVGRLNNVHFSEYVQPVEQFNLYIKLEGQCPLH
jgi:hypothetical protein